MPGKFAEQSLFLINDLRMGGAERSLVNFVNHLRRINPAVVLIDPAAEGLLDELNAEVELFSLHQDPPKLSPAELRAASVAATRRPRGRPRGQMLLELPGLLRKAFRLARLARANETRIVSAFLNRAHTIALLAKFLFAPGLRVVINLHETLSDSLERHFAPMERRLMRGFIARAFPHARLIIAVSEGVKQDLVRHFGIRGDRIVVVPNPIDVTRIRKAAKEPIDTPYSRDGSLLIVGVGRLVRLKGFDVLLRAFVRLPETLRVKLIIVGDGEERPALEQLMTELETSRVELVGTQVNPWKYMARADVLAVPSRFDSAPNVIGEAFALSVPVVAARCSEGVSEYLDGGRCGVLVPPEDVAALASVLERILTDDELRRRLATQGASRAADLDLPRIVQRYEQLLADAAG